MTDNDAVLALNQAFYRAFAERDIAVMDRLWASGLPVSCIHPGWAALFGRGPVMESWTALLSAPEGPAIRPRNERVSFHGDSALVLCEEVLGGTVLAATNLFARESGSWRLVHHQAGPVADPRPTIRPPAGVAPRRLH